MWIRFSSDPYFCVKIRVMRKTRKMIQINEKKYRNVILYLSSKLGGEIRGKKKLAKLLYFVDFDYFEKKEEPITGDIYKALPMGPFPVHMESIIKELVKSKKISIDSIKERPEKPDYNATEIYRSIEKPDGKVFNDDEIKVLDRVVLKYGHLSGKQLEDLTHAEAPYIGTKANEEIAYELSFYRGTDFSHD